MARIKIFVDTSCDLPQDIIEKYNFGVLSFLSVFGEKTYISGKSITNEEFYKMLSESDKLPKTSQTPYSTMFDELLAASKENDTVIYFTISSKGSGQNHTAKMVVDDILEDANKTADIRLFDSMSFSLITGRTAIEAAELANNGKSPDEIIEYCTEYIKKWHAFLLVNDLTYLEKGGRINKTSAILGGLLDIKPVLTIKDGLIECETKLRGKKKIYAKLIEMMLEYENYDKAANEFMIVHSDIEEGKKMQDSLLNEVPDANISIFSEFGPIVGTNTGNKAVAILFRTK